MVRSFRGNHSMACAQMNSESVSDAKGDVLLG